MGQGSMFTTEEDREKGRADECASNPLSTSSYLGIGEQTNGSVAKFRLRRAILSLSVIYTAKAENCSAGDWGIVTVQSSCPLRIACITSMPAVVQRAVQNEGKLCAHAFSLPISSSH
jgi:hypothetical protein